MPTRTQKRRGMFVLSVCRRSVIKTEMNIRSYCRSGTAAAYLLFFRGTSQVWLKTFSRFRRIRTICYDINGLPISPRPWKNSIVSMRDLVSLPFLFIILSFITNVLPFFHIIQKPVSLGGGGCHDYVDYASSPYSILCHYKWTTHCKSIQPTLKQRLKLVIKHQNINHREYDSEC